jgi:hypothetical protein
MLKVLFLPFSLIGGLLAGLVSKRVFAAMWGLIDEDQPPTEKYRRVSLPKLAFALALNGAVVRLVRGLFDHGARVAFLRLTGRWPGEERGGRES